MDPWLSQMRKGLVEVAILARLSHGEDYGYGILERLGMLEGLSFSDSTVYPALSRLHKEGYLSTTRRPSPDGPPRKYYAITDSGRARLATLLLHWRTLHLNLERLVTLGPSS